MLQLRSVLTALQPAELVLPRGEISGSTRKVSGQALLRGRGVLGTH